MESADSIASMDNTSRNSVSAVGIEKVFDILSYANIVLINDHHFTSF